MKKYITTSLLLFIPFMAMAADHCTNPKEYTIDKRCYVTDAQKKTKPYNAVVALVDWPTDPYCTGTIVKGKNGKPYLYTAKHCVVEDNPYNKENTNNVEQKLTIKLQTGEELSVYKNNVGNFDATKNENLDGDWAVYSIKKSNVPMVEKTNKAYSINPFVGSYNAKQVGYGMLKIMSDKEISQFKQKYIKYLKDQKRITSDGTEAKYGWYNGGIYTGSGFGYNFLQYLNENENSYYLNIFRDSSMLKVSVCEYTSMGRAIGCQGWGGNSGGPIFDDNNKIMGIHTRGNYRIGGEVHAGNNDWWGASKDTSVNLLK